MDGIAFEAEIIEWRGPAPYLFAVVPEEHGGAIRFASLGQSYGWGVVPVVATVGDTLFATTLFPREGTYMLPIKVAVQRSEEIGLGDRISVVLRVGRPERR